MAIGTVEIERVAKDMLDWRRSEAPRLAKIDKYMSTDRRFPLLGAHSMRSAPRELKPFMDMSHINVCRFVVRSSVQSLYLDGFRSADALNEDDVWSLWRRNGMASGQIGVNKSALSDGASYIVVLPGKPVAKMRGVSARSMTAVYPHDDDQWADWALERVGTSKGSMWRLYDNENVYVLGSEDSDPTRLTYIEQSAHGMGVTPVVRLRDDHDLDGEIVGQVEPLMSLQDQIDATTFALLVAQHYGAHGKRYLIGWAAETREAAVDAMASSIWSIDADPESVEVGEFSQINLDGYIESREATFRHVATLSQTPVHELLGSMANLSAEALVAARDSHNRMLAMFQTTLGEGYEQALRLAGQVEGISPDPSARVRWHDMESQSLSRIADAVGKLAESVGVPRRALWEMLPNMTQDKIASWERMLEEEDDPIRDLQATIDSQLNAGTSMDDVNG